MTTLKDQILNGVLAVLVISSVALSSQVWFPSDPEVLQGAKEAQVQAPPPESYRGMPDVFRPDRILVKRKDGRIASLPTGSIPYGFLWRLTYQILLDVRPSYTPPLQEDRESGKDESESIALMLPTPLRLGEWAEQWNWLSFGLLNQLTRVDTIRFELGKGAGIYLSGPEGGIYQFGPFTAGDQKILREAIQQLDDANFAGYRPLNTTGLPVRVHPGVLVRDLTGMPLATVRARKPDQTAEEARFFPDMSVVRHIDEQDAKSFTDGQRLLRITSSGVLEYRAAQSSSTSLDFKRGLQLAQEWIGTHGGWPQELVLERYSQEAGVLKLRFEIRSSGPHLIESWNGALQIDLAADRVSYFKRHPDFTEIVFTREQQMIITAEEALRTAAEQAPLFLLDEVRDLYPTYLLRQGVRPGEPEWVLDPVWAIRVGVSKLYVSAPAGLDQRVVRIAR